LDEIHEATPVTNKLVKAQVDERIFKWEQFREKILKKERKREAFIVGGTHPS